MTRTEFRRFLAESSMRVWQKEQDCCIKQECEDCGWSDEYAEGEYDSEPNYECPECGNNELMNYTLHETCSCQKCGSYIDMWNDCYSRKFGNEVFRICEYCFEELESDEEEAVELHNVWEK